MKPPHISTLGLALAGGISLVTPAFAIVSIDYVSVGNAGNAADSTGYGAVSYAYKIGQYEVTNAQYTEFLNAVDPGGVNPNDIYNANMGSHARGGISFNLGATSGSKYTIRSNMDNKPVNFVSWNDAARFTNWLNNGQGAGSTETGAYDLSVAFSGKNIGATVWLPSENEWYKAAYYDPTPGAGGGDNYWTYATQSNTVPTVGAANSQGDISNPGSNVVNYSLGADWNGADGNVTTVGSAAANNYFGTADMNGNVWEWNEAVVLPGTTRGLRGASLLEGSENFLRASFRNSGFGPANDSDLIGFRVAGIPEPSALVLTMLFSAGFACRRKR